MTEPAGTTFALQEIIGFIIENGDGTSVATGNEAIAAAVHRAARSVLP